MTVYRRQGSKQAKSHAQCYTENYGVRNGGVTTSNDARERVRMATSRAATNAFVLVVALTLAFAFDVVVGQSGEEVCELQGFGQSECNAISCCKWDDGACWSAVGPGQCSDGGGGNSGDDGGNMDDWCSDGGGGGGGRDDDGGGSDDGDGGVLLPGVTGWADGKIVWSKPPQGWSSCAMVTTVFGTVVCVSKQAWSTAANRIKCDHIVNVYYQLLDNDGDGRVDDPKVLDHMVNNGYLLWVPATESEAEDFDEPNGLGVGQMTGLFEAVPNCCHSPSNRGADAFDRSTWAAAVDTSSAGCSNERDATTEEILHLITAAAGRVYPDLWAPSFNSQVGAALKEANGNCGWGYQGNWIDPSSNSCTGQFAYNDRTCDEECNVVEGIYWASVSYVGGLYTNQATEEIESEWLMATPDADMPVRPQGVTNAVSLQAGNPALYALVSDTTSEGHAWLPAVMPDGKYTGTPIVGNTNSGARSMLRSSKRRKGSGFAKTKSVLSKVVRVFLTI